MLKGFRDVKKSEGRTMVLLLAWLPLLHSGECIHLAVATAAIDDSQGTLQAFRARLSFLPSPACKDPLLEYPLPITQAKLAHCPL